MPAYTPIATSDGKFEIQGVSQVFDTASAIIRQPVEGDRFYHPDTERITTMYLREEYQPITATGLLSKFQLQELKEVAGSDAARNGELTATHQVGDITTLLTGVRIGNITRGEYDELGTAVCKVSVTISYEDERIL